jgi:hypothetical protein
LAIAATKLMVTFFLEPLSPRFPDGSSGFGSV